MSLNTTFNAQNLYAATNECKRNFFNPVRTSVYQFLNNFIQPEISYIINRLKHMKPVNRNQAWAAITLPLSLKAVSIFEPAGLLTLPLSQLQVGPANS